MLWEAVWGLSCSRAINPSLVGDVSIGLSIFTDPVWQLAKLTSTPKTGLTNLEKEIYSFVFTIVAIMLTMIVVVIIVWYARKFITTIN